MPFARVAHIISVDKDGVQYRVYRQKCSLNSANPEDSMIFSMPDDRKVMKEVDDVILCVNQALSAGAPTLGIRCLHSGYAVADVIAVAKHDRISGGFLYTEDTIEGVVARIDELISEWQEFAEANPRHSAMIERLDKDKGKDL